MFQARGGGGGVNSSIPYPINSLRIEPINFLSMRNETPEFIDFGFGARAENWLDRFLDLGSVNGLHGALGALQLGFGV